jgi:type IV pilus assembly protein PilP
VSARFSRRPLALVLAGLIVVTGLAGCGGEDQDVQSWMEAKRRNVKSGVPKLQPPSKFDPEPYVSAQAVDPFSAQKLSVALKQEVRELNPLLAAELNRRKEPLEAYPLDSMTMVGSFVRGSQPSALLRVDNLLYQVKMGEYLGQNYGRITKIGETELSLREVVQDAAGEWIERISTLQLQEKAR